MATSRLPGGKCSISAYESGKVVIAGKEAREFIEFYFEPEVLGEARLGYEEIHHPEYF
jgi:ribonuclease HIII